MELWESGIEFNKPFKSTLHFMIASHFSSNLFYTQCNKALWLERVRKMNIKKQLVAIAAIGFGTIAVAPVTQAGPLRGVMGRGHRGQAGAGMEKALDKLNLTNDQKAKIKPITDSAKQQIKALKSDTSLSTEEKKAKGREIMMMAFAQIKPILTPAQQEQAAQMIQQARAKRGQ